MSSQTVDLLTLLLLPGVGRVAAARVLAQHAAAEVSGLSTRRLNSLGIRGEALEELRSGRAEERAETELAELERRGGRLLIAGSPEYPQLLSRIEDPPPALWVRGRLDALYRPAVAVVGARRCSSYGREVGEGLARRLAETGLTVVSGLARGVDRAAHEGALSTGGVTVAVLGTGLDIAYPAAHRQLQDEIGASGCLVSEQPLGTAPRPGQFPARNRIISGLTIGTLVVEGSGGSGSLITAAAALSQNRELWAVPGCITSTLSAGPNRLIQQGALPVIDEQDILAHLPAWALAALLPEPGRTAPRLSAAEAEVLELLRPEKAIHFDEIAAAFGGGHSDLSAALLELEMKGLARAMAGDRFSRRWYPDSREGQPAAVSGRSGHRTAL